MNITYIVKYYPPIKRVSGVTRYYTRFFPALAKKVNLTVITYRKKGLKSYEEKDGYKIIRTGMPFNVTSVLKENKIKSDCVVFGTGLWQLFIHLPYTFIMRFFSRNKNFLLHQNVALVPDMSFLVGMGMSFFKSLIVSGNNVLGQLRRNSKKDILLLPSGIDFDKYQKLNSLSSDIIAKKCGKGNRKRIGYFGQFIWHKDPEMIVDAFLELNRDDIELFMAAANESDLKDKISKRVEGKNNIIMNGYLDDIDYYIKSCDIVVVPFRSCRGVVGLALTVMEAMALERAVIGSQVNCVADLIDDGKDGFVFKDKEDLKDKLNKLIDDDKLRHNLGKLAAEKMKKRYDLENTVDAFVSYVKKLNDKK